jgi:uncharacterized membrane protein YqiK
MGKAFIWFLFCLTLMVLPWTGILAIAPMASMIISGTGAALLVVGTFVIALLKFYIRTKANEGFVRTGRGGAQVVLDGGTYVIPVLHEIVRVPLETMRLDVDRTGADALITADKLRADLKAEFYIRVQPNRDDVLNAARSLGEKTFDLRSIEELVKDKLISTLRAVAATRTLDELNAKREEFAAETKKAVEADLRHNGLTLETVTVSKLDQTDPQLLNPHNVFDAQGLRRIAEITQAALVERNRIERDAEQARTEKDVSTRQQVLELERKRAEAEALQAAQIASAQAERQAEARKAQIEQEQFVAAREVEKARAVQQANIEAQQQIIQSRREQELVEVARAQAVATAEREKEVAIALAEQKKAEAEQQRLAAETERARQEQMVLTVQVTAAAERDGEQKLIAAKKAAEEQRYQKQVAADVVAYALQKEAEGKKAAAEAEYQAKVRQAQADAEAAQRRAEGDTAAKMVEVNVARSRVEVDAAQVGVQKQKVDVEAQALANREKYGRAAIEFELGKLRIEANKETQIAVSQALGEFFAKSNFTMFGDPESARKVIDSFMKGMGLARVVDGFIEGTDAEAKELLGKTGGALLSTVENVVERVTKRDAPKDKS